VTLWLNHVTVTSHSNGKQAHPKFGSKFPHQCSHLGNPSCGGLFPLFSYYKDTKVPTAPAGGGGTADPEGPARGEGMADVEGPAGGGGADVEELAGVLRCSGLAIRQFECSA